MKSMILMLFTINLNTKGDKYECCEDNKNTFKYSLNELLTFDLC